jgi:hypothetical protein
VHRLSKGRCRHAVVEAAGEGPAAAFTSSSEAPGNGTRRLSGPAPPLRHPRTGHRAALLALAMLPLLLLSAGPASAEGASATAYSDAGVELMRLTNLDRLALGYPALAEDPTLVALATDRPLTCPSGLQPAGRALDLAQRGYFDHAIPGCATGGTPSMTLLDLLPDLGYKTFRAENIGWNEGYGTATVPYTPGCDLQAPACPGVATPSIADIAAVEQAFLLHPEHRAIILGAYDRFGCGAARTAGGTLYVACLFSRGGPSTTAAATFANDRTAPVFTRVLDTPSVVASFRSHEFAVLVRDETGLGTLAFVFDGQVLARWALTGRSTGRYVVVPASRMRPGPHSLRWTLTDATGNRVVLTRRVNAR